MTAAPPPADAGPLAMICGGGSLPLAVADYVAAGGRRVVLFPLHGAAEGTAVERHAHHWLHVGQIGKFLRLARAEGCRDVVFIGALVRPSIWQVRPDLVGLSMLPRVLKAFRGGDNHLLSGMGELIESKGLRLLGAHEVAPQILMPEGRLGRVQPSENDRADIAFGLDYLRAAGPFDVGQAVVVAGRHILAVEAAEGTDGMLARVADMRINRRVRIEAGTGILVKAAKPDQDRRFDLPSIGPMTVERTVAAGLAGIAVVAGDAIIAEPGTVAAAADNGNIFVVGVPRTSLMIDEAAGRAQAPHIFMVAGEESGDRLGGALIAALKRATDGRVRISGIGGEHMAAEGMPSLFPLGDLAIIGFAAIIKNLSKILQRINQATDAIIAADPDVLVIIDSPEFTHRVARKVRARAPHIKIVDYVCPSVWAWRPGRARAMLSYVDLVLALLPFEPETMKKLGGPRTEFVGHPLGEQVSELRPDADEARRRISDPPLLLVLPGSRSGEIRRMTPMFGAAIGIVARKFSALEVVVPAVPRLAGAVQKAVADWPVPVHIVTDPAEKRAAFRQARAALTKSGTSTLELALAGVPMVASYQVSFPEAVVGQLLITAPSAILANLVLGENVIPEFLQWHASAEKLASALEPLLSDTPQRRGQIAAFSRLTGLMNIGGQAPSERAAALVLQCSTAI